MRLKRINSYLTIIIILLLLVHVAYEIFSYATFYYNPFLTAVLGFSFAAGVMAHAVISCYFLFRGHEAGMRRRYPKANIRTVVQRISAFLILIFLLPHILTVGIIMSGLYSDAGTFVLWMSFQVLFFFAVYLHITTSFTRALVTLGLIKNRKTQRMIDIMISVILGIIIIIALVIIMRTQYVMYFGQ